MDRSCLNWDRVHYQVSGLNQMVDQVEDQVGHQVWVQIFVEVFSHVSPDPFQRQICDQLRASV